MYFVYQVKFHISVAAFFFFALFGLLLLLGLELPAEELLVDPSSFDLPYSSRILSLKLTRVAIGIVSLELSS